MIQSTIHQTDCMAFLRSYEGEPFDLTFLDPPFNQNKKYNTYEDNLPEESYWGWMEDVCRLIYDRTSDGGAVYFMQREKNAHRVMQVLERSGWSFQNLIIWKKKTSAVPIQNGFGKHYQIIVFAVKGKKPRVFNRLRINPPRLVTEKQERPNGVFVTDVWHDIRELTSGYFAGREPLRLENGKRLHEQQAPIELLARIILSSSKPGDLVFDPFAGTGTTVVVAKQLNRNSIGIEFDELYAKHAIERIELIKPSDDISKLWKKYTCTKDLEKIWGNCETGAPKVQKEVKTLYDL